MAIHNNKGIIHLDEYSKTPKYKQIIDTITQAIENGQLSINDKLPSVNDLLIEFDISRDTVVKAYDYLKEHNIIESVPGKGYYIKTNKIETRVKVLLLFNKLSAHKKIVYDAFHGSLEDTSIIDFYVYNNDFNLFKKLLLSKLNSDYSHYVISPHFIEGGDDAHELINQIPRQKLIILDKLIPRLQDGFSSIYQDFENDIYFALAEMNKHLQKYQRINLVFPIDSYHPVDIKEGFIRFCTEFAFEYNIVTSILDAKPIKGDIFINVMEDDLPSLIKLLKEKKFKVGEDIGIISYNETLLKEVLLDGITTISTDFYALGKTAAEIVLQKKKGNYTNPFKVVYRNSL